MATYPYTGTLTDFAEQPIAGAAPRLRVMPERDSFGPSGPLASRGIPVSLEADGKTFTTHLVATVDTSPQTRYTLVCDWFAQDVGGQEILAGWAEWTFTAAIGGGEIKDMFDAPASVWFVGPPWPAQPVVGAFYLDRTGDQPWARYTG
jgi:hypothetical protein